MRVIHGIPQGAEGGDYASSAGFKRGEAFLLISDEKGGYLLIPKVKNPYTKAKSLSFHQEEAWPDFDYEDIE
ncbi:transcription elongation factor GreAB [Lactobacillus rhamnosus]|uniref:Transcription elongation factor GreAB n=1 Tax=Lacticaseibacillus rhamnosus TaxID=47715 RepID=A0A7Y7QH82_LACRH|nr:transcription elongation factor GreAB [Lacticaseibacillus rhamnosus]NVO89075.1 transcription elongation factor GreAB [Lacticaseibacillus rhamnosus]